MKSRAGGDILVALLGLANLFFEKGHRQEGFELLRRATKAHPDSKSVRHNLAAAERR